MTITLRELAQLVDGQLRGDGALSISGAAIIRDARPGDITLLDNAKLAGQLSASQASAAVVSSSIELHGLPFIAVDDVHRSFAKIIQLVRPQHRNSRYGIDAAARVHPTAIVPETASIGADAEIGPRVIVGENVSIGERTIIHGGVTLMQGSQIGSDCEIFPNVVCYENTVVADRVMIHAGCILGAYGFGYVRVEGRHCRSAQLGYVKIECDVEIGAGTTIDRGTYGATLIGEGTKIDNQVMIAHNCRIGRHNLICSHVGIAGSATTGDYVILAGQAGVRDHVNIGDRAVIMAQAGVMNDVPANAQLLGTPAISERDQMHVWAASYKLPEMRKQFKAMQRILAQLHGPDPDLAAGDSGIHQTSAPLRESA